MRLSHAILAGFIAPFTLGAQATTVDEPLEPSLLTFVRQWTERLSLGDLRALSLPDSALEVRFWEGFGLGGTRGLVLKRSANGDWTAFRIHSHGYTLRADTLAVPEPSSINHPQLVWATLVATGMLGLPTRVPRSWMMLDGHTYVLEVRRGQHYRASQIEDLEKPEVPADAVIRRIASILARYFEH